MGLFRNVTGGSARRRAGGAVGALLVASVMGLSSPSAASADPACTLTWDGGGMASIVEIAANWSPDQVPGPSDWLCFTNNEHASVTSALSIEGFTNGDLFVSGGGLSLTSTTDVSTGVLSVLGEVVIGPGAAFYGGATLEGGGMISGEGTLRTRLTENSVYSLQSTGVGVATVTGVTIDNEGAVLANSGTELDLSDAALQQLSTERRLTGGEWQSEGTLKLPGTGQLTGVDGHL